MPHWLKFNPENRTLYGRLEEQGNFVIDVTFFDDFGAATYFNLKLIVSPSRYFVIRPDHPLIIASVMIFLAFMIWIIYLMHYTFSLKIHQTKNPAYAKSKNRFG